MSMERASYFLYDFSKFFNLDGSWILEQPCISVGIVADGSVHRNHHPTDWICMSDVPAAVGFGQHRSVEGISGFGLDELWLFRIAVWYIEPGMYRTVPKTAGKEDGK